MAEFTGQTYGEATRQRASQRIMRPGPPPGTPTGPPLGGTEGDQTDMAPFDRSSEFPDEPVTTGSDEMPGVGIQPGSHDDLVFTLRAIASRYPNKAILALLEDIERDL